ncbi:MAG: 4Fe-4S dicluster domain-containing protein [Candidatus Methanoperedens sp.]|nr:4Fe-4S dicluster domain-containing protein [Candidatus Methanoperedens sp.]
MNISRREFTKFGCKVIIGATAGTVIIESLVKNSNAAENWPHGEYDWNEHYWGFVVDNNKCIGCGRCAYACKLENHVPFDESWYRTWVERYRIKKEGETKIDSPNGGVDGFTDDIQAEELKKAFYVPKLCNHCDNPPCVQVCPVGATYLTKDGVVLVDYDYCIGCRYCIMACPYGARYFNSKESPHHKPHPNFGGGVADKCTWCYHRITKGLLPACVQACPVGARVFGDLKDPESAVNKILDKERINVLKPDLGTKPKVYYVGMDREVR